jgi:hypothetical protein
MWLVAVSFCVFCVQTNKSKQQSVLESMGSTGVISEDLKVALDKLRERLGLTTAHARYVHPSTYSKLHVQLVCLRQVTRIVTYEVVVRAKRFFRGSSISVR